MMLSISTTKFLIAELAVADYNFHRWTSKPTEYYSVNSKPTCKPPELHTIMKKCNGTGMVLKICETKNNVWKRHILSIQNSIDNHIKTTRIKPNFASLNKKVNPYKACSYGLCRDFLDGVGYDLGTNCSYSFFIDSFAIVLLGAIPVYSPISSTVGCITIPFSSNFFTDNPINKFWFLYDNKIS